LSSYEQYFWPEAEFFVSSFLWLSLQSLGTKVREQSQQMQHPAMLCHLL
jgi:hypothetical protein